MWGSYFLNGSFPRALCLDKIFYYLPGRKVCIRWNAHSFLARHEIYLQFRIFVTYV